MSIEFSIIIFIAIILVSIILGLIAKSKKIGFISFIFSLCNFIVLALHSTIFPKLFGHCNTCLGATGNPEYKGIDFSRRSKVLGTFFDANDAMQFLAVVIFIITAITYIVVAKKENDSRTRKIIATVLGIIVAIVEMWYLSICTYM